MRSRLEGGAVTIHMIVAMALLTLLMFTAFQAMPSTWRVDPRPEAKARLRRVGAILFGVTLAQMVLGTEVREAVDLAAKSRPGLPRRGWLGEAGVHSKNSQHKNCDRRAMFFRRANFNETHT